MVVPEGEELPRWYGIAWRDWSRHATVAYPVPLHWLAGLARRLWYAIRAGIAPGRHALALARAFSQGKEAGRTASDRSIALVYRDGYVAGMAEGELTGHQQALDMIEIQIRGPVS